MKYSEAKNLIQSIDPKLKVLYKGRSGRLSWLLVSLKRDDKLIPVGTVDADMPSVLTVDYYGLDELSKTTKKQILDIFYELAITPPDERDKAEIESQIKEM